MSRNETLEVKKASKTRPRRYSSSRSYSQQHREPFGIKSNSERDAPNPASSDALFSSESSLENVFHGLDKITPILTPTPRFQPRRQALTASEGRILDDMFDMVLIGHASKRPLEDRKSQQQIEELYSQLSSHKRPRATANVDAELDRKREQMELCQSDLELLQWAKEEVFGESRRFEEAAKLTHKARAEGATPSSEPAPVPPLQPPAYSQMIALLIEAFRDKYHDPHLALAMFEHARKLSVASYVFGCTTLAYNERIKTLWRCFRDLRGVLESLEEMKANGIMPDTRTRSLVDVLRREAGQSNLSMEESEADIGQVAGMLNMIEKLVAKPRGKAQSRGRDRTSDGASRAGLAFGFGADTRRGSRRRVDRPREDWKNPNLHESEGLEFGHWPTPSDLREF
ncbi:hypothetical protein EVG20_g1398 [Dentipellis fragilis]|uniref:Mtf2-like C-terminal domain-containing protein n=1 Tax=Dentipellis fragilis TaxID=205917 RepID=A0A4Y9ZCT3_9AGAM|nr:hypothetical protein EVG20_g1398 [Dentipellis fragilis]